MSIYPYPKFQKCFSEEEAREWLREHSRVITSEDRELYGNVVCCGYARVEYFIHGGITYYNVYTKRVGYLRIDPTEHISVDNRRELIKIKVKDTVLDDYIIQHHIIAINRILKLIGDFVDVDVVVPDLSIYLAAVKYTGKDYSIRSLQRIISNRLGGFSVTVREKGRVYS